MHLRKPGGVVLAQCFPLHLRSSSSSSLESKHVCPLCRLFPSSCLSCLRHIIAPRGCPRLHVANVPPSWLRLLAPSCPACFVRRQRPCQAGRPAARRPDRSLPLTRRRRGRRRSRGGNRGEEGAVFEVESRWVGLTAATAIHRLSSRRGDEVLVHGLLADGGAEGEGGPRAGSAGGNAGRRWMHQMPATRGHGIPVCSPRRRSNPSMPVQMILCASIPPPSAPLFNPPVNPPASGSPFLFRRT